MRVINTSQFTGSFEYHKYRPWGIVLTDGALFVAKEGNVFWLMDEIGAVIHKHDARHAPEKLGEGFFVVKLEVFEDRSACIRYTDGNDNAVSFAHSILFTDYPDKLLTLYVQYSGPQIGWVVMVPSEY